MSFPNNQTGYVISGVCSFVAIAISSYNVFGHLKYYTKPKLQLQIVRILFIVPIYALVSWLSLCFAPVRVYFETIRDCYEAFIIYCFLVLILEYTGGELQCVSAISKKPPLSHPTPLCCLPKLQLNVRFLRMCKQGCIQFVIIKPVMACLSIIMLIAKKWSSVEYQAFMLTIYNISYTLALYALFLFYLATSDLIKGLSPVKKFLAVKCVVFATYYQSLIFLCIPNLTDEEISTLNDFVLCLEMVAFSILHYRSFPWWEFQHGISDTKVVENLQQVTSIRDVVADAVHNFSPGYASYALSGDTGESFNSQTWMVKPTGIDEDMRNDGELLADCDMRVPSTQMIAVPTEEFHSEITSYGVP